MTFEVGLNVAARSMQVGTGYLVQSGQLRERNQEKKKGARQQRRINRSQRGGGIDGSECMCM